MMSNPNLKCTGIKKLVDTKELIDGGYLQEVNRFFFHPLGLGLTVVFYDDGSEPELVVQDFRDEEAGVVFSEETISSNVCEEKAKKVQEELIKIASVRIVKHKFIIQPISKEVYPYCVNSNIVEVEKNDE